MTTLLSEFRRNLADLPASMTLSSWLAGLVVVVVGSSGPLLIIIQAAEYAKFTPAQVSSWVWSVTFMAGVMSIVLSLLYRQPIIGAFSTPGAVLLGVSLSHFTPGLAVGSYLIAAAAVTLIGVTGLFSRVMQFVPQPIALGMLAGVLIQFTFRLFTSFPDQPLLVGLMIVSFFLLRRFKFRVPTLGALLVGFVVAGVNGQLNLASFTPAVALPVWTTPEFSIEALLNLSFPLLILAMTAQNAPGFAVLRSYGYHTPIDGPITITGIFSLITAPFLGSGINLSAITAAMVANPDAHPDATRRYAAGVATGVFYMVVGIFGATVVGLFAGVPKPLIDALAGLALIGAISNSLNGAMAEPSSRDAALVALVCTASGVKFLEIGAPFWGLVAGMAVHLLLTARTSAKNH